MPGTVYLLHFDQPIAGRPNGVPADVLHYIGFSDHLSRRYSHHIAGRGARLVAAVAERGIPVRVVRTWSGGRDLERRLKRQHHHARLCPSCVAPGAHSASPSGCVACAGTVCRACGRHLYRRGGRTWAHVRRIGCRRQVIPGPR